MNLAPQIHALLVRANLDGRSVQGAIGPHLQALVHYVRPLVRLIIFGAGNDARPLCTLGRSLGWHVCVADRRARLAMRARFPDADQVVAADWWTALRSITFSSRSAVVVMTHSLTDDAEILPLLVDRTSAYLGMLGPEHRRRWLLENMGDAPLPKMFIDRLHSPVGLDLGERSPAGIAVSIVSEILAELNGRTPAPLFQSNATESQIQPSAVRHVIPNGCPVGGRHDR